MNKAKKNKGVAEELRYSKRQFIQSDMYTATYRDVLRIILDEDKRYSKEEIENKLKKFKKKEVK